MMYVLCLIIGIGIGHFLSSTIHIHNESPLELKDDLESIGFSYSKDTLDDYDDEIFIMDLPYRNTKNNIWREVFNNDEQESHESYLNNLDKYKEHIDQSPNKFLKYHLENALFNEQYELAEYIKQTAKNRNFKL